MLVHHRPWKTTANSRSSKLWCRVRELNGMACSFHVLHMNICFERIFCCVKALFTQNFNSCQESSWELERYFFLGISLFLLSVYLIGATLPRWGRICSLRYLLGIYFSSKAESKVSTFTLFVNPKWSGHSWRQQVKQVNPYHRSCMILRWYKYMYVYIYICAHFVFDINIHTTSLERFLFSMPELCRICISSFDGLGGDGSRSAEAPAWSCRISVELMWIDDVWQNNKTPLFWP